jgi:anti-sigma B factor antagonist
MESGGDLLLDVRKQGIAHVVRLVGAIGMAEATLLGRQLDELVQQPDAVVVLDIEHLEFICSSGLGALIDAHAKARPYDGEVRLASPCPMVMRLLETTRLTNLFPIYASVDEAITG